MKILKNHYFLYLLLISFTFSLGSCASKKNTASNKKIVIESKDDKFSDKNILYIVDGKEVSSDYIKTMNPNDIDSLTVIKGDKHVAEYTDKKYDGVIIIKLKKK